MWVFIHVGVYAAGANGTAWEATGVVLRITSSEEVALELHTGKHDAIPSHETNAFAAELTWNSTAYDRMHPGLNNFAENSECMSMFLYHKILGHEPELPPRPPPAPAAYHAPNMPVPNHSQLSAIDAAIGRPFTLIQVCAFGFSPSARHSSKVIPQTCMIAMLFFCM